MKVASAMKAAIKGAAAMKKVMKKPKRVSKIAKGKLAKALVLRGSKEKTGGGLSKADLLKNRHGRVVSKKRMSRGKQAYNGSKLEAWAKAATAARKALGITGFCAMNGKNALGKALYAKT